MGLHDNVTFCYFRKLQVDSQLLSAEKIGQSKFELNTGESNNVTTNFLIRTRVNLRASSLRIEARGIFPGAEVVRGHDWRWGNQDGKQS